jgi:hypothetical protein
MGRWGKGIYDSDSSLDYLSTITDFLMKDVSHWFAPEQVYQSSKWLENALILIEIMLIFSEADHIASQSHLMDQHTAIRRWQEIFLRVWDAELEDTENHFSYSNYAYRIEQRQNVNALFDRLSEIAASWRDDLPKRDLQPFNLNLPMFSITRFRTRHNRDISLVGRFLSDLIEMLTHRIVFILSEENREKEWGFDFYELEELWVTVDILGLVCEKYQVTPGIRPQTVQRWLDTSISLWLDYYADAPEKIDDAQALAEHEGQLYTDVLNIFIRFITVAQQYPGGMSI